MAKGLLRYVLFLIILFLLGLLYNSYEVFALLATFAVAGALLLFIWMPIARKVTVDAKVADEIVNKGENIELTIIIRNATWIPLRNVSCELHIANEYAGDTTVQELYLQSEGKSECGTTIALASAYCGNIHIGVRKIYAYDDFGIIRHRLKIPAELTVAVLPKRQESEYVESAVELLLGENHEYSTEKSGDDVSEIFDIREYHPGDSYKRIHRKLSMKMDDLLVKECGLPVDCSLKILLDFRRKTTTEDTLKAFDAIICEVVALGEALNEKRIPFYLAYFDYRKGICRKERVDNHDDLYAVISLLYSNVPGEDDTDILRRYEAAFPLDSTAMVMLVDGEKHGEESQ